MKRTITTSAVIAMLLSPISDVYAEQRTNAVTNNKGCITEKIEVKEEKKVSELRRELSRKFDSKTIDSIFNDAEFKIEKGVMYNWNGCKADGKEKFVIRNYDDYKRVLGINEIFELKQRFMEEHKEALEMAEKRHKVNKEYITGIIGIETKFGNNLGRYKTVNALASTYVFVEKKRKFALDHLAELIDYSKRTKIPIFSLKGSYAGATGFSQFLPWSLNREFVGEAGDVTKSHPFNMRDAIFSSAYYLSKRGFSNNHDKAILRYNNSKHYLTAVKEIAMFRENN